MKTPVRHERTDSRHLQRVASVPDRGQYVELLPVRVTLFLDAFEIEGTIHVAPDLRRFSDAWETLVRDPRQFIPVSDAVICRLGHPEIDQPFIQVRKGDVRAVCPVEKKH